MIKHTDKGGKGLFHLTLPGYDPSLREVKQHTKELEGESVEERSLLVCYLLLLFRQLSYTIQDHAPRCGTTHSGMGTPTSISNQENVPTDATIGQCDGGNSSVKFPLSQVNQGDNQD